MARDPDTQALLTYLSAHDHVISTSQAWVDLGLTSDDLRHLTHHHLLVSVCRGGYADARALRGATPEEQHAVRTRAVLATNDNFAATAQSAAAHLGLPLEIVDLERVHVVRRSGQGHGRRLPTYTVHEGQGLELHQVRGIWTVGPLDAVILSVADSTLITGQALVDAALRTKILTRQELQARVDGPLPTGAAVRAAVEHADPGAESLGESAMRLVVRLLGHHMRTQVEFRDERGFVARVDGYLEELGVALEFDGAVKYAGADGRDALVREKRREDRLRALGLAVVRLTWSDLREPERVTAMIQAAARSVAGRPRPLPHAS